MDAIRETVIWLPPAEDHERAEALGLIEGDRLEYEARVAQARAMLEEQGVAVVLCQATPDEVLETLVEHELPNDQQGRAAAFAILAQSRR